VNQPERFKTTKFGPYWFCSLAPTFQDGKGTEKDMTRKYGKIAGYLVLVCCLAAGSLYGRGDGDKVKIKGLITTRTGETLTVKTQAGSTVTVVLTDDTKVQQPKGLGVRKKEMGATVLVPGLRVTIDGVGDAQSNVTAKSINFDSADLEMSQAIQAGLTPTKQAVNANAQNIAANKQATETNAQGIAANQVQTAANKQEIAANQEQIDADQQKIQANTKRFSELSEYDTKADISVNFSVGSSVISANDKAALSKLAQDAVGTTGYIIQVKGFADSSGNAAMNQKLSMDRAQEVIAYLIQDCNVPVRHVVAPGAMGTADPAAPNETAQGRADNRRVEVKVLVNKGLSGQ
jgi:outer membrane protein OmpA-like peptidoglycan-associated protein